MSNYVFPSQQKKSDYEKFKAKQDELLKIQISNNNIEAETLKKYKNNEPMPLNPIDNLTAQELLEDESQQEQNVRINLERLGFKQNEITDIINSIRSDPNIDYQMINLNFPSIENDLKKRFNIKLITPTFFTEYLKKYSDELSAALGMKIFNSNTDTRGINGMINNVQELRNQMPTPQQIQTLLRSAINQGLTNNTIITQLTDMAKFLPTQQQLDNISLLDPVSQQREINNILRSVEDLPSKREIQDLQNLINANALSLDSLDFELRSLSNSLLPKLAPISFLTNNVQIDLNDPNIKLKDITNEIIKLGFENNIIDGTTGRKVNLDKITKKKPLTNVMGKIWWEDTNIRDLLGQPQISQSNLKTGTGILKNKKKIIGKGIQLEKKEKYLEFGKYVINTNQLEQNDLLSMKYNNNSLSNIVKYPSQPVSDIFRDFLIDLLENGKPDHRLYNQIEKKEKLLFQNMAIDAGLWNSFKLPKIINNEFEDENEKFEILKGEFLAGNTNQKMITDLRKLVIKMMNDGRIKRNQGVNLLLELS